VSIRLRFLDWLTALASGRKAPPEPYFITGSLSPRVVFLAIRRADYSEPDLVVVFRLPLMEPANRITGNFGGGVIAANSKMPAAIGFRRQGLQVICSFDSTSRVLEFPEQAIDVGASNVLLCDAEDWDCHRVKKTVFHTHHLQTMKSDSLRSNLLSDMLVQQFVDRAESSKPE
jgi:hypothetical protein